MKPILSRCMVILVFLAVLLAVHGTRGRRERIERPVAGDGGVGLELAAKIFPDGHATVLDGVEESGWTLVMCREGNLLGAVLVTSPYMDAVMGFAGPTPLLIGINAEGVIVDIVLLENNETPGYVSLVLDAGFLDNWTGLAQAEAMRVEVDAVSGATATSLALAETIAGRLAAIDPIGSGRADEMWAGRVGRAFWGWSDVPVVLVVLAGAALCWGWGFRGSLRVKPVIRYLVLCVSVVVLGFWSATMFSMALMEGWAIRGRVFGGAGLITLVLLAVLFPLITGKNCYCHYLCPFGALQELLFKISPLRMRIPPALYSRLRWIRYGLLAAVAVSMAWGRGITPDVQEPFSAFQWRAAGWPAMVIATVALGVSVLGVSRPWCSFFCSSGALLDALRAKRKKPPSSRGSS